MRARPGGVGIFDGFFGVQELGRAHREATKVEWPQPSSQLQVQKLREVGWLQPSPQLQLQKLREAWMAAAELEGPDTCRDGKMTGSDGLPKEPDNVELKAGYRD